MKKQLTSLLALATAIGFAATASADEIPRPSSIEVTRDNYQRVVTHLADAGLNRSEINRWLAASKAAGDGPGLGNFPSPQRLKVTRDNYQRIVNAMLGLGYNRKQIERWINASIDANYPDGDRSIRAVHSRALAKHDRASSDRMRDRKRDRARHRQNDRRVERVRDRRIERVNNRVRPVRVQRVERATRPVRGRN